MGLFDLLRPSKDNREAAGQAKSALDAAKDPEVDQNAITKLVEKLLSYGIDGLGPYSSAEEVAASVLKDHGGDREKAIDAVQRRQVAGGALGGAATSLGGFVTMPVALPVNVVEFYVQATRLVAATAVLRGYDVKQPEIRTAILLTLIGTKSDDVLAKAGLTTGGGRLASLASKRLPESAMMIVNKAVGFRLLRSLGEHGLEKLGRGIPLVGGLVGGGLDGFLMHRIAQSARREFPLKRD